MKQLLIFVGLILAASLQPSFSADTSPPAAGAAAKPAGSSAASPAGGDTKSPAKPAAAAATPAANPVVLVVTSMGNFKIELNAERAPLSVANFLNYVDQGQYTNTLFHRVVANFVIQGGGFDTDYNLKVAAAKVPNESGNGLSNIRGTVGMARTQEPHGANDQFYVNLADNAALDPNQTRWGYAVFGRVISGMEVVDRIGSVATSSHGILKEDVPVKPVVILRIERAPT
jgi:peptidyl-prolyl cis-trans isomerase A (cyclophilin A)